MIDSANPGPDEARDAIRRLVRLARVVERADVGLSLAQYRVLTLVSSGDDRAGRLAARLSVAPPTLTAIVDGLACAGYVLRAGDAQDRRVVSLAITPAGQAALDRADAAFRERLTPLLSGVSDPPAFAAMLAEIDAMIDAGRHRVRRAAPDEAATAGPQQ